MLTGSHLLARIKELGDRPRADLVRSCGYVSTRKDGQERLNFTAFYEALLNAKGMHLGRPEGQGSRRRGRKLSYATKVQFNGNLMIGSAYVDQLGVQPGEAFEIRLGKRQIKLVPLGGDPEA
ncbi:MAG: AbrB family transcriptional regulator [Synechococcaceae cyanobacterium]|nr:AbrB family transcriptional regulator [Synechococcaceae cyanobacterium]